MTKPIRDLAGDNKMRGNIRFWRFAVVAAASAALSIPASCQSSALWSGTAQCTVTEQDQTYQRQEVQTWALTGAAPTQQGAMQIYPATWTDTGAGQLARAQGAQTNNTVWQTNAQGPASIAFWIRASDGRLIVSAKHARQSVYGGISATRQISLNGVVQSPTPLNQTVYEWMFPRIEADPSATVVDGTAQSPSEALPADFVHRFGTSAPLASCQWHFAKGGMSAATQNPSGMGGGQDSNQQNPTLGNSGNQGQNCQTPATIQQSFETMKAQLKAQYDQLIAGTTDSSEAAALRSQEQKMLASLSNQEQHDMTLASQGCLPPSNTANSNQTPTGGTQNPGTPATGGQSNQTQTGSGTPATSGTGAQGNQTATGSGTPTPGVSLTTASAGTGSGVVAMTPTGTPCGANCAQYNPGTAVTVIAVPSNGSSFAGFSGGGCASVNPCSFTITAPTIVAAAFSLNGQTTATGTTGGATSSGTTTQTSVNQTVSASSSSTPSTTSTMTRPPVSGVNVKPTTGVVKTTGTKTTTSSSSGTSTPPAPSSATYRVTVNGLLCTMATTGGGDAVYASVFSRQYDRRNDQLLTYKLPAETQVYGNVNGMEAQRQQAGSMSATGGIGIGNFIPTDFVPGIRNSKPPHADLFPMLLFEGSLTDGVDVVILSPSLWESYGDLTLRNSWVQNELAKNDALMLDAGVLEQIKDQWLGIQNVGYSQNAPGSTSQARATNAVSTEYDVAAALGGPSSALGGLIITSVINALQHPGVDRPLGLVDVSSTSIVLPNTTVVLTREIIERYLGTNSWMTMAVHFKDTTQGLSGGDHPGDYTMFLEIDRE